MDLGLTGARVFVAAASAGIGRACAELFVADKARVVIAARDATRLEAARAELGALGEVHAIAADLNGDAATTTVERAIALLGGLDVLVVNGGGPPPGKFEALDDATWLRATEATLLSTARMIRAARAALAASGRGRVIVIASTSVKSPIDGLLLSNSLRLGVVGLAKTLSYELAPSGITVNVVCPGMTDTDRIRELDRVQAASAGRPVEEVAAARVAAIPLKRLARPQEIASAVVFLASTAASYITGVTLTVDGGLVRSPL
jgi:3-oxoacyl-[acyl-carrier protein] reductase